MTPEILDSPPFDGSWDYKPDYCATLPPNSFGSWIQLFSPPKVPWTYRILCVNFVIVNSQTSLFEVPLHFVSYSVVWNAQGIPIPGSKLSDSSQTVYIPTIGFQFDPEKGYWASFNVSITSYSKEIFIGVSYPPCLQIRMPGTTWGSSVVYTKASDSLEWESNTVLKLNALRIRAIGKEVTSSVPPGWTCTGKYKDGTCDCNCGVDDADCLNISPVSLDCDSNSICAGGTCKPHGWNTSLPGCDLKSFGTDDLCNCGCGTLVDPDCLITFNPVQSSRCPNFIAPTCPYPTYTCSENWKCSKELYHDNQTCNCQCSSKYHPDPDCMNSSLPTSCKFGNPCYLDMCSAAPRDWVCSTNTFNASSRCDCGCGTYDPDCDNPFLEITCGGKSNTECAYNGTCIPVGCGNNHADFQLNETCDSGFGCDTNNCSCLHGYYSVVPLRSHCSSQCRDGIAVIPEQCDLGTWCSPMCKCSTEHPAYSPPRTYCHGCGNAFLDEGEECDSGSFCNSTSCKCLPGSAQQLVLPPDLIKVGCYRNSSDTSSLDTDSKESNEGITGLQVLLVICACIGGIGLLLTVAFTGILCFKKLKSSRKQPPTLQQVEMANQLNPGGGTPTQLASALTVLDSTVYMMPQQTIAPVYSPGQPHPILDYSPWPQNSPSPINYFPARSPTSNNSIPQELMTTIPIEELTPTHHHSHPHHSHHLIALAALSHNTSSPSSSVPSRPGSNPSPN